jgi:stage V sporulation protein K
MTQQREYEKMTDKFQKYGGSEEPSDNYQNYGAYKIAPEKPSAENCVSTGDKKTFDNYPALNNQMSTPKEEKPIIEKTLSDQQAPEGVETNPSEIDKLINELNSLVGLSKVKSEIQSLLQFVRIQELRRQREISTSKPSLHSVFYGSPGTGKTTIARLYGKMLSAMGLLSKGHLVETDRSGLIGGYIGQTAIKTDEKIKEALGGILFIDEAYSLSKGEDNSWDYGNEAIAILLKRMEDYRDDFVVIVAGYPDPMGKFIASNEGLRSRFNTYIHFDDYSPSELAEIFKRLCETENYAPTEEALEFVFTSIDYNYSIRDKSFGNARYIRNLFEIVIRNQALRIGTSVRNPSQDDLRVILPSDIPFVTPSDTKVIQNSNPREVKDE